MDDFQALADLLGRERLLLEILVYRLVELRSLLVTSGRPDGRFLAWAAEEVEDATAAVRAAELERAMLISQIADAAGVSGRVLDPRLPGAGRRTAVASAARASTARPWQRSWPRSTTRHRPCADSPVRGRTRWQHCSRTPAPRRRTHDGAGEPRRHRPRPVGRGSRRRGWPLPGGPAGATRAPRRAARRGTRPAVPCRGAAARPAAPGAQEASASFVASELNLLADQLSDLAEGLDDSRQNLGLLRRAAVLCAGQDWSGLAGLRPSLRLRVCGVDEAIADTAVRLARLSRRDRAWRSPLPPRCSRSRPRSSWSTTGSANAPPSPGRTVRSRQPTPPSCRPWPTSCAEPGAGRHCRQASGRLSTRVVPPPGVSSASRLPPCASARPRATPSGCCGAKLGSSAPPGVHDPHLHPVAQAAGLDRDPLTPVERMGDDQSQHPIEQGSIGPYERQVVGQVDVQPWTGRHQVADAHALPAAAAPPPARPGRAGWSPAR